MNRLLSCTAVAALLALPNCGGGSKDQEAKAPSVEPPAQTAMAPTTPAAVPTGPSSDQSPLAAGDTSSTTTSPGSTTGTGSATSGGSTTGTGATSTSGSTTGSGTTSTSGSGIGGGAAATSVTDDQILQALHTANSGEIEQAKLAQQKSKNAQVKHFASMMVKDHTDADHKGQDVAKKTHLSPSPSAVSTTLESDAKQMTSSLSSRTGAQFDRAYIDAQVKQHQALLDVIDSQLLPNAKTPEVKSLVQTMRPKVQSHLKEAQDIQRKLAGS
jgi:putative membrane protein